jgi:hypothetical protein
MCCQKSRFKRKFQRDWKLLFSPSLWEDPMKRLNMEILLSFHSKREDVIYNVLLENECDFYRMENIMSLGTDK